MITERTIVVTVSTLISVPASRVRSTTSCANCRISSECSWPIR
jgi:hypothetical protein